MPFAFLTPACLRGPRCAEQTGQRLAARREHRGPAGSDGTGPQKETGLPRRPRSLPDPRPSSARDSKLPRVRRTPRSQVALGGETDPPRPRSPRQKPLAWSRWSTATASHPPPDQAPQQRPGLGRDVHRRGALSPSCRLPLATPGEEAIWTKNLRTLLARLELLAEPLLEGGSGLEGDRPAPRDFDRARLGSRQVTPDPPASSPG